MIGFATLSRLSTVTYEAHGARGSDECDVGHEHGVRMSHAQRFERKGEGGGAVGRHHGMRNAEKFSQLFFESAIRRTFIDEAGCHDVADHPLFVSP